MHFLSRQNLNKINTEAGSRQGRYHARQKIIHARSQDLLQRNQGKPKLRGFRIQTTFENNKWKQPAQ
jgi:hypothetical protein